MSSSGWRKYTWTDNTTEPSIKTAHRELNCTAHEAAAYNNESFHILQKQQQQLISKEVNNL